jgi:putative zinc finger protein
VSERFELNDELLCAYMDGELDPETRVRVEQALVDDTGARVRLERMRVADERLKVEIPLPASQPNDPLSARILGGKPAPLVSRPAARWGVAVSALAAGISGVVVGFVLSRSQAPTVVPVVASVASTSTSLSGASSNQLLLATLENGESGKAAVEGDRAVQVILTFESDDGRYCRAFGARDASAAAEGVACRSGGQWQVVAWDGTANPSEGFRAAGSSELLDDVMDRLGGSPALEVAEERTLIEQHWQAAPQR